MIKFQSPLSVKYQGEFIDYFNIEAIIEAIKRRIYILDCFEGIESNTREMYDGIYPLIQEEDHRRVEVPRYSNRKDEKMVLWGLEGSLMLQDVPEGLIQLILAGELLHIGKNSSFGFGRYRVKNNMY